jgi:hypothetical protein|tara:strand:- start:424 stop:591 length:168 start_codon:yes stop_codon:yes gene_type:complete
MGKKKDSNIVLEKSLENDNICEECHYFDSSVKENLIMHSFKLCNSCKTSKIIFPV